MNMISKLTFRGALTAVLMLGLFATMAPADGFLVPRHHRIIRPGPRHVPPRPIPIRGHWAVEYHHVDIRVRDQVASIGIDQKFVNTGRGMIEVEYFFPVPPGAAIDSMTLVVNGKEFAARLLDAEKARKIYEDIVRRKKDPALLEYMGYGLYRTKAFPLEPGKPCRVQVTYKMVCKKNRQTVEVWYPLNTEKFSAKKISDVRVTVDIKSKSDIPAVYSPTHSLNVKRKTSQHVIATYHEKNCLPTTDFQVFYKASNKDIGATLLTHQPEANKDGYFLMLVSPNPKLAADKVQPKEVVIVFDHSGSMAGAKMRQTKSAVEYVLKNLNPQDRFNVIAYNDGVEAFFKNLVPADEKNIAAAMESVDRIDASGGTNISEALATAMRSFSRYRGRYRPGFQYVIFLTDGQPTVGKTDEKDILIDVKQANRVGARLFAFGVGYDVNVRLLDNLVQQNNGRSDFVKPAEPIEGKIATLYNKIKNPVMTNLSVEIKGVRIRDMYPRQIGDLFDGDQIVLAGRYDCRDAELPVDLGAYATQLIIKGNCQGAQRVFEYPVTIRAGANRRGYDFVEKIWAVRRVGYLMDQVQLHGKSKEIVDELIRLSTKYGIMTPYTSFLADETTPLHHRRIVTAKATESFGMAERDIDGASGQRAGAMRKSLNEATQARQPSAPGKPSEMIGNKSGKEYEAGRTEKVKNFRKVGGQAVYRRGRLWVAANASDIDPKRDAAKIQEIKRFSDEYFRLAKDNTVAENQVFASQQTGEDLMISLRGKTYRIR
jgi:Ca-activated chloride channel family protein